MSYCIGQRSWTAKRKVEKSNVYWTVHHCNNWRIKDQIDVTCYFISLLMYSTCHINISIIRSLRLCCWIATSVVLFCKDGGFSVSVNLRCLVVCVWCDVFCRFVVVGRRIFIGEVYLARRGVLTEVLMKVQDFVMCTDKCDWRRVAGSCRVLFLPRYVMSNTGRRQHNVYKRMLDLLEHKENRLPPTTR